MGFLITPNQLESGSNGVQPPGDFRGFSWITRWTYPSDQVSQVPWLLCFYTLSLAIPSGKLLHNYRTSPFSSWIYTLNMVIFHSYVKLPGSTNDERELSMAYHATYFE
jgi:hypothetical protein